MRITPDIDGRTLDFRLGYKLILCPNTLHSALRSRVAQWTTQLRDGTFSMKRYACEAAKLSKEELRKLVQPGERPTLKTIARISGLAVPTVSRALGGADDIGSDTKKLVKQIAAGIGYVPNRAGVRLRTGRTNVIALVIPADTNVLNNASKLTSSIALELRDTPYHLNVLPWFQDEDPLGPIKYIVETRSADAVIFDTTEPEDKRVEYLLKHDFPFATHGRTIWSDHHSYYDFDNTAFARVALQQLASRGRQNILAILPPINLNYAQDMLNGLQLESQLLKVNFHTSKTVNGDQSAEDIGHWIARHLKKSQAFDGVICTSPIATIRRDIIVELEDIGIAGRYLANAVVQRLRDADLPPMQHLEVPTDRAYKPFA